MIAPAYRILLLLIAYVLLGSAEFTVGDGLGWTAVLLIIALLVVVIRFVWIRATARNGNGMKDSLILDRIRALDAEIKRLRAEKEESDKKFQERIDALEAEKSELKRQAQEQAELRRELEEQKVIAPTPHPRQLNVLGVWAALAGIDPKGNAQALELAGVKYNGLFGDKASMEYILYELRRDGYNTIEVGGAGNADAIQLADGMATADWWSEVAAIHKIELFLFLADNSTGTNQISIADAVYQVPTVNAVISVQGAVPDLVARRFCRMLYASLTLKDSTLASAMREARLAVTPEFKKLFVLREKEGNKGL